MNKLKLHTRHDLETSSVSPRIAYWKKVNIPVMIHITPLNVLIYLDGKLVVNMIKMISDKEEEKHNETLTEGLQE
jgi:hypothetical protein